MARLKVLPINICGLNDEKKRQRVAAGLQLTGANIVCVQETHIEGGQIHLLNRLGFKVVTATTQGARTKGVAILGKASGMQLSRFISDTFSVDGRLQRANCLKG